MSNARELQRHRILFLRQLVVFERALIPQVAKILNDQANKIGAVYRQHHHILPSDLNEHNTKLLYLFKRYYKLVMQAFGQPIVDAAKATHRMIERKDDQSDFTSAVAAWIDEYGVQKITAIGDSTEAKIKQIVSDGYDAGLSAPEIADKLTTELGEETAMWRAQMIVVTELHSAANASQDIAAENTGQEYIRVWCAANDKRTRETHAEASGQERDMEEPFNVGNSELMFPGDPSGDPSEVINCRCVLLYQPKG